MEFVQRGQPHVRAIGVRLRVGIHGDSHHESPGGTRRSDAGGAVFHGDALLGPHGEGGGGGEVGVGVRLAARDVVFSRQAQGDACGQPGAEQPGVDLAARRGRDHGERDAAVAQVVEDLVHPGERLQVRALHQGDVGVVAPFDEFAHGHLEREALAQRAPVGDFPAADERPEVRLGQVVAVLGEHHVRGGVVQGLGVEQRAVEVEQHRCRRKGHRGVGLQGGTGRAGLAIVLALAACSGNPAREYPRAVATPAASQRAGWRLELPAGLESWRPALTRELAAVERAHAALAGRWEEQPAANARTLVVVQDAATAATLVREAGLGAADARVARTGPGARLAVVPLARWDVLLVAWPQPPQTLRATFRHEAAHLLALDRAGLAAAPRWFQEGLAEAAARLDEFRLDTTAPAARALAASLAAVPPEPGAAAAWLEALPAEARLEGQRRLVLACLGQHAAGTEPWLAAAALPPTALAAGASPATAGRPEAFGRDADLAADGAMLLASPPDREVSAAPWRLAAGETLALTVEVGNTGVPAAGLLLHGPAGRRVRVRIDRAGRVGAREESGVAAAAPVPLQRAETRGSRALRDVLLELRVAADGALTVQAGALHWRFPAQPGVPDTSWRIEAYVRDGALVLRPR